MVLCLDFAGRELESFCVNTSQMSVREARTTLGTLASIIACLFGAHTIDYRPSPLHLRLLQKEPARPKPPMSLTMICTAQILGANLSQTFCIFARCAHSRELTVPNRTSLPQTHNSNPNTPLERPAHHPSKHDPATMIHTSNEFQKIREFANHAQTTHLLEPSPMIPIPTDNSNPMSPQISAGAL